MNDVSVAILAGGQSRRMGADKSFVTLNNKLLIECVLHQVQRLKLPLFIVANNRERYEPLGFPVFPDVFAGKGSLGGIYSALHHSTAAYTLCIACDMPFLVPELLHHLIDLRHDYDAVVPEVNRRLQPLHAVYSAACLNALKAQIEQNELAIYNVFHHLSTRVVSQSTLVRFDPDLRSFINVNTPDDLLAARREDMEVLMSDKPSAFNNFKEKYPEVAAAYDALGSATHEAGPLDDRSRQLVKLAFAVAAGLEGATHSHTRRAVEKGISPDEIRHVVLLAMTTLGFPAAIRAMTWVEDVLTDQ